MTRQAGATEENDEIEITPEMIEAGASVLFGFETFFADEELWAARVFETMVRAHRVCAVMTADLGVKKS